MCQKKKDDVWTSEARLPIGSFTPIKEEGEEITEINDEKVNQNHLID